MFPYAAGSLLKVFHMFSGELQDVGSLSRCLHEGVQISTLVEYTFTQLSNMKYSYYVHMKSLYVSQDPDPVGSDEM